MDANGLSPKETLPASAKLGRSDAIELATKATTVIVSKGKKVTTFKETGSPGSELVKAMLGPTGNLRAPVVRAGKKLLVGFNEEEYRRALIR